MSSDVTIVLPDGTEQALGPDATGADLAEKLGGRAAKAVSYTHLTLPTILLV